MLLLGVGQYTPSPDIVWSAALRMPAPNIRTMVNTECLARESPATASAATEAASAAVLLAPASEHTQSYVFSRPGSRDHNLNVHEVMRSPRDELPLEPL